MNCLSKPIFNEKSVSVQGIFVLAMVGYRLNVVKKPKNGRLFDSLSAKYTR